MATYRIVKIEKEQYGRLRTFYRIEKKFLFWFFPCRHIVKRYIYGTDTDCSRETYNFDLEEKAKEALLELRNPSCEKYKGYTIEKIIDSRYGDYHLAYHKNGWVYGWPRSVKKAKGYIDETELVVKKTIVYQDK